MCRRLGILCVAVSVICVSPFWFVAVLTSYHQSNARRLAARDNWPPISWVDWPPNVGQLAASLIVLMLRANYQPALVTMDAGPIDIC